MTGKILPFARPASGKPQPESSMVTREERPAGDVSFTLTIDAEEIVRAILSEEFTQLEAEQRSERLAGEDASQADNTDANGFLYADDDGPN